jgi:hypothetical protein
MSMINLASEAQLLKPGLAAIVSAMPQYPTKWSALFETYDSDKNSEIEVEMRMLGPAQIREEGQQTAMDVMGQRIISTYTHQTIALGFEITKEAIEDNLYKTRFPMYATALKNSMDQAKEILAASILGNAFNSTYPGGDGHALISSAHPIDTGTYSNGQTTASDLNEASLESALIAIATNFKDQAGMLVNTRARSVHVAPANQFVIDRILGSQFRVATPNNDINAMYNMSSFPEGFFVNPFFTNTNAYFILTDAPDGLKHYKRIARETDMYADFKTDVIAAKATERYSFGWTNPRGLWGGGYTAAT